jgi:hypothetical protein
LDNLAFSLRTLCQHNADGSEATRANRQHGLMAISRELKALGYKLPDARSLKPKHVTALVAHWKGERLSDATIKNRLAWMRWWAMKTAKPGLVPKDNTALGVADTAVFKGKRAAVTPLDRLGRHCPSACSSPFGFRWLLASVWRKASSSSRKLPTRAPTSP